MFHVPEQHRITDVGAWATTAADGNNGAFLIPSLEPNWTLIVIVSDGDDWEHVSVHAVREPNRSRTPTWKEMAFVKRLFWDDDDVTMQLYPKQSDYVNCHPHTLHWWRPMTAAIPTPPAIMVGPPNERP